MKSALKGTSDRVWDNLDDQKPVRLINVLQTYFELEQVLSGSADTCSKGCDHYSNVGVPSSKGCIGSARSCKREYPIEKKIDTYRKTSPTDRLYEGYKFTSPKGVIGRHDDYGIIPSEDSSIISEHKVSETFL